MEMDDQGGFQRVLDASQTVLRDSSQSERDKASISVKTYLRGWNNCTNVENVYRQLYKWIG